MIVGLQRTSRALFTALVLGALFGLWELLVQSGVIPAFILPAPSGVLLTAVNSFSRIAPHMLITLAAVGYGIASAFAAALVTALLMHRFRSVRMVLYPLLVISQTVPLIVLAPLFILWFGFGILPKVLVVILVCFFPIAVNTLEGLDSTDRDITDLFASMGAGGLRILFSAKLPAALPHLFSGLKIAATYSMIGAVIGEWLGGTKGLGVYMVRAQKAFAIDQVFAAILYISAISISLLLLVLFLQRLIMPWHKEARL